MSETVAVVLYDVVPSKEVRSLATEVAGHFLAGEGSGGEVQWVG